MKISIIKTIPPALPLTALSAALRAQDIYCIVLPIGRDGVKISLVRGIDRKAAEMFVAGFIAGFEA